MLLVLKKCFLCPLQVFCVLYRFPCPSVGFPHMLQVSLVLRRCPVWSAGVLLVRCSHAIDRCSHSLIRWCHRETHDICSQPLALNSCEAAEVYWEFDWAFPITRERELAVYGSGQFKFAIFFYNVEHSLSKVTCPRYQCHLIVGTEMLITFFRSFSTNSV